MVDGIQVTVGTGHEQISQVQNAHNQLASERTMLARVIGAGLQSC